ncbi:hypothetical protein CBR_g29991 [Chara braunii]|uniref:Uncharacterized protein n=1 Tax=Chara braunii TaxID=69332 RepID=A0A388LBM0_CHABU|nr:hypothetical protein CBR_g29991 [Chara braunii]|eukprot:GBG79727.1 hypothetical protein CBR_g29991 [Chara braunii]
MEGNSNLLQFAMQLVKSEVNAGAHNCEFMVVKETRGRMWNNKTHVWFKLSERKRNKIYDFLLLQTRQRKDTNAEYVRRRDHMFLLLDNYHGASFMKFNGKTFLERLQSLYFVESEEELKFSSYFSLISTEDEETTGVEFDANAKEEHNRLSGVRPGGEGESHCDTAPTKGSSGVAKEAFGSPQSTRPGPEDLTQSANVPTSSFGSVREMMAALVALRGGSGGTFKSAGIRTTMVEMPTQRSTAQSWSGVGVPSHDPTIDSGAGRDRGGRLRIMVPAGGAACMEPQARSSEFDKGSGEVDGLHAREGGGVMEEGKEGEEREEGEEGEEGEEREEEEEEEERDEGDEGEEEEEEGKEGEEGGKTELSELFEGKEGAKGDVDIGDDERTAEYREGDDDNDATTMEMETRVVSNLSAERDDYEVQALMSIVDLQHRLNEAPVAVSLSKLSGRIDVEEVIDGIRGDHQVSAQTFTTPDVDDPRNVKPSTASAITFSPPNSPILSATIPSEGKGGFGGRQHVTSSKKTGVSTQALDVLVLPAPSSPTKEWRDKPAGRL